MATAKDSGRIPSKFLSAPELKTGVGGANVADNAVSTARPFLDIEVGRLDATCTDLAPAAGEEDGSTNISVVHDKAIRHGGGMLVVHSVNNGEPVIATIPPYTDHTFTVGTSGTFEIYIKENGQTGLIEGVVQSANGGPEAGGCSVNATAIVETL